MANKHMKKMLNMITHQGNTNQNVVDNEQQVVGM